MSWETRHVILSIKSDYKTWVYDDSIRFCDIYLWTCVYQYIRLSDNIHIQKCTHWAAPRLLTLRVFPHISLQVRIIFFLFHLVYGCAWPKCFVQVEFLMFSLGGFWSRLCFLCDPSSQQTHPVQSQFPDVWFQLRTQNSSPRALLPPILTLFL